MEICMVLQKREHQENAAIASYKKIFKSKCKSKA
jgi:hypothetical protein